MIKHLDKRSLASSLFDNFCVTVAICMSVKSEPLQQVCNVMLVLSMKLFASSME